MPRYVAFLRAINVGGHTVKMEKLRALFEEIGLENVSTFIASGNVLFDSPLADTAALEKQIEQHLTEALGYSVVTFLRTPKQLAKILDMQPYPAAEVDAPETTLYIGFLPSAPAKSAIDKLMAFSTHDTELRVRDREIYWLARVKLSDSKFTGAKMERAIGMPSTLRNVTTVQKITAIASGAADKAVATPSGGVVTTPVVAKPKKKRTGDRRTGERRST